MTGAESLVRSLLSAGVDCCFSNPGTSEIHIVAALDRTPEMRCVLGLFEGVVTAAADGYARMTRQPACTLLHLGPGLANGLANLHNARRAQVPIVNIVGQHASYHLKHDTPLTSDVEAIARSYSHWVRTSQSVSQIGKDGAEAVAEARKASGRISTLIVPADVSWGEGGCVAPAAHIARPSMPDSVAIDRAAEMLRSGLSTAVLMAGDALYGEGLLAAGRIAAGTGAKLLAPYPVTRLQRGAGLPPVDRTAYILEQAKEQYKQFRHLILVGTPAPVAYFAYPGKDSVIVSPECTVHTLSSTEEDCAGALAALSCALGLGGVKPVSEKANRPSVPNGDISLQGISSAVGALLPEGTIVVDESMTSGRGLMAATKGAPPHEWLGNTGGSIGIALPLAVGAAVACPYRRVLCFTADGSGMYTLQALWTMVRENLNITTVIFSNREYAVLKREFSYLGVGEPGPRALSMFDLGRPELDWSQLAKGMGVPSTRVTSLDSFARALQEGIASEGPTLIEIPL